MNIYKADLFYLVLVSVNLFMLAVGIVYDSPVGVLASGTAAIILGFLWVLARDAYSTYAKPIKWRK